MDLILKKKNKNKINAYNKLINQQSSHSTAYQWPWLAYPVFVYMHSQCRCKSQTNTYTSHFKVYVIAKMQ